jgi:hypothetical protein
MPPNPVALDANLLVLLVVGLASDTYVTQHKRLKAFTIADYQLLQGLLANTPEVFVSPHTLTEASNLIGQIAEPALSHIRRVFRQLLAKFTETTIASRKAADDVAFLRLGLTDAVLLDETFHDLTLLTTDLALYLEASRRGRTAINFHHYIEANRSS